jgi:hypothetical protein
MRPGTAGDRVNMVREALARFNSESLGLHVIADEIGDANGDVLVVGRVQERRGAHLSRSLPMAMLWEFEDDDLVRIDQFASKPEALDAARSRRAISRERALRDPE